mmetsp:Transcript_24105/g.53426  ORF Transcript_24105/g.53426 Transcript_24105/m.53426 type:complete len:223 (+) Transcript_24105:71-739(+)
MVFEVFEDREYDTRGFAMRRGHRSRLLPAQVGRNKFKISTSSGRDIARCGMCRPGRHHGAGGAKAYKKVNPDARAQWQRVLGEARHAELAGSGALEPESDQLARHQLSARRPSYEAWRQFASRPSASPLPAPALGDFIQCPGPAGPARKASDGPDSADERCQVAGPSEIPLLRKCGCGTGRCGGLDRRRQRRRQERICLMATPLASPPSPKSSKSESEWQLL